MATETSSAASKDASEPARQELPPTARENLEVLSHFAGDDAAKISGVQLAIERVSAFFGSPSYFLFAVSFIVLWAAANAWAARTGWHAIDPPPFSWLQGAVSCNALLLTVAVLIRQNRMAQLAEHRSHLDLQINLLTEQKVTKIVAIVDELHREVRRLGGRSVKVHEEVEEMTKPADPHALLHAIKQHTGET